MTSSSLYYHVLPIYLHFSLHGILGFTILNIPINAHCPAKIIGQNKTNIITINGCLKYNLLKCQELFEMKDPDRLF